MINILIGNVDLCTLKLGFDYLKGHNEFQQFVGRIMPLFLCFGIIIHHIHDKHCHKMLELWHLHWPISVANKLSYYRLYYYFTLSVQWALLDALYSATLDIDIEFTLLDIFFPRVFSKFHLWWDPFFRKHLLIYDLIEL